MSPLLIWTCPPVFVPLSVLCAKQVEDAFAMVSTVCLIVVLFFPSNGAGGGSGSDSFGSSDGSESGGGDGGNSGSFSNGAGGG